LIRDVAVSTLSLTHYQSYSNSNLTVHVYRNSESKYYKVATPSPPLCSSATLQAIFLHNLWYCNTSNCTVNSLETTLILQPAGYDVKIGPARAHGISKNFYYKNLEIFSEHNAKNFARKFRTVTEKSSKNRNDSIQLRRQ